MPDFMHDGKHMPSGWRPSNYQKPCHCHTAQEAAEPTKKCETCEGKGYLEYGGMAMEDDLVEKEPCFDCDGTGQVQVTGLVPPDQEASND